MTLKILFLLSFKARAILYVRKVDYQLIPLRSVSSPLRQSLVFLVVVKVGSSNPQLLARAVLVMVLFLSDMVLIIVIFFPSGQS